MRLLQGHSGLILGFFSFLPDSKESWIPVSCMSEDSRTLAWMARSLMVIMQEAQQERMQRVSDMLVERIRQIVDNVNNYSIGQLDLNSILHSIVSEDSQYSAIFPSVDALRALMSACYQMTDGGNEMIRPELAMPSDEGAKEMSKWYLTMRLWLLQG